MIATISMLESSYSESLSTLQYANRVKNIKNLPKINEDPKDAMIKHLIEETQKLRAMIDELLKCQKENCCQFNVQFTQEIAPKQNENITDSQKNLNGQEKV